MEGGLCAFRGSVERVSNGCDVLILRGVRHGCSRMCGPGSWLGNVVEKRGQWAMASAAPRCAARSVGRSRPPEEIGHVLFLLVDPDVYVRGWRSRMNHCTLSAFVYAPVAQLDRASAF